MVFVPLQANFVNMKKLLIIVFWIIGLYAQAQIYEKGVSKELAESRIQNISNVSYDLIFDIPANLQKKIAGTVTIEFFLRRKSDVVLDFQGYFSGACIINGKQRVAQMENEHIIIPQKLVKKGINRIEMNFVSLDKALNRNTDYLYALFDPDQARSCFPCFDQPDIYATFTTQFNIPKGWKALANKSESHIPTSLYSFIAGKFEEQTAQYGTCNIRLFHHEHSPERLQQLPTIIDETTRALKWMESYTGLKYPFEELGIIIGSGNHFCNTEQPGIIQLSDRHIFFDNTPSRDDHMKRMERIAHEVAHQWFGYMVRPKQCEDIWPKEVLANFMASKIVLQQFKKATDYNLNFLQTYQSRAIALDRTEGTHPINQNNNKNLYDDIIYAKAPVMMRILENLTTPTKLQEGLQKYLTTYYFKSASWDDFINILDRQVPTVDISQFNEVWVKQKGMPTIHTTYQDGQLIVTQTDPYGRGIFWPQKFEVRLIYDFDHSRTVTIDMKQPTVSIKVGQRPNSIIPNYDGLGYGLFTLDKEYIQKLPLRLIVTHNDQHRYALLNTLHDNYLMGNIPASYFGELYRSMIKERNPLIMQTTIDHMFKIAFDFNYIERQTLEQCIMDILSENKSADCRQIIIRKMSANATAPEILTQIEKIWNTQNDPLFDDHDYMEMAYRLALTYPGQWQVIINKQRERLKSDQLRQEFEYVSRACTPDEQAQQVLFNSIIKPENRPNDSWALHVLQLLNADIREPQNNIYIFAGLNSLESLQQNSDLPFINNWLNALLQNHKSREAQQSVENFLKENPTYQENLRHQILAASWLLRNTRSSQKK